MIRLTVEQLMALRDSIQGAGQVQCAVLPLFATASQRLIIAWAKGRSEGEEFYLSIWKDTKALQKAMQEDEAGIPLPFDFINDQGSMEYSHTYPVEDTLNSANSAAASDLEHEGFQVRGAQTGRFYQREVLPSGRVKYGEEYMPGPADSGHPEYGVTHGE